MKTLYMLHILSLTVFFIACQTKETLQDRVNRFPLLAHQSIDIDTASQQVFIVSTIHPNLLKKKDSLAQNALGLSYGLLWGLDTAKELIKYYTIIYVNKYYDDLSESVVYGGTIGKDDIQALAKASNKPAVDPAILQRVRGYTLSEDEFFRIDKGTELCLCKNVDIDSMRLKVDSLLLTSQQVAKKLLKDVVGKNGNDFPELGICLQDRHATHKKLSIYYSIKNDSIAKVSVKN